MKHIGTYIALLFLLVTPVFWAVKNTNSFIKSESQYLNAFGELQPGWTSETLYQSRPLGPVSICETSSNEVLILDKPSFEILELELNGSVSTFISLGNISLDAIAYQPNADRIIAIGEGAFYKLNETKIEVVKEYPMNVSFSTLIVNPVDDSIYTGHWLNDSKIYHFNSEGEYISTIRTGILGCTQVAVDASMNLLYYAETFPGRITRLNMTTNTTSVLTSGIAIPSTGEGIGIATHPTGVLYYYVAEGTDKGFYKYNGTGFENIMGVKLGTGPIAWSEKFQSILCTPGYGACVVQYDPNETEPMRVTPTVNTRSIVETSEGLIYLGVDDEIFKINAGVFSDFITDLPFDCSNLVMDKDENIYASLSNDSVSILQINPDGTNSTWFTKEFHAFPNALVYDSYNDMMVLMTNDFVNETFDIWRLPIDNPYDYSRICTMENVTSGDFTIDDSGNIFVLERGENILYKIPDGSDQPQVLTTNVVEHAVLVYPHIAYSSEADAIILCRNDDLQAFPANGSSSYILGVSATGIDHEGLFENADNDLVGTHSGQIFKLSYDDSTSTTTSTETTTSTSTTTETLTEPTGTTTPFEEPSPLPMEIVLVGIGAVIIVVVAVVRLRTRK